MSSSSSSPKAGKTGGTIAIIIAVCFGGLLLVCGGLLAVGVVGALWVHDAATETAAKIESKLSIAPYEQALNPPPEILHEAAPPTTQERQPYERRKSKKRETSSPPPPPQLDPQAFDKIDPKALEQAFDKLLSSIPMPEQPAGDNSSAKPSPETNPAPTTPSTPNPSNPFAGLPIPTLPPGAVPAAPSSAATGSSATPVEIPPPTPAGNPLATIGDVWKLPSLVSAAEETLGSLASVPAEPITIAIRSMAATLPAQAAYYAEPAADNQSWQFQYLASIESSAERTPLGTLRLAGTIFKFAWLPAADPALRRQLANCLLHVKCGEHARYVQVRPPYPRGPCVLDLATDKQTVEFELFDLPKAELMQLEVGELEGFPEGTTISDNTIEIGKESKIKFTKPVGAEIGLKLFKPKEGNLSLRLEPVFKENAATQFDLTLTRLDALAKNVNDRLAEAKRDLPAAERSHKSLVSQLNSLASRKPANIQQMAAYEQQATSLRSQIKRAASRIKHLQDEIPECEVRLAAVPEMRKFLESLHERAAIRYRLVADCGETDLVLVDGTSAASSAP